MEKNKKLKPLPNTHPSKSALPDTHPSVDGDKIGDRCIDCKNPMFSECFLHGAYCESCDNECPTCVKEDLSQK